MVLLVVAKLPPDANAMARVAGATGIVLADVSLRLAGTLPRILLMEAGGERLDAMAAALDRLGFVAFVVDPVEAPSDRDRVFVRRLELAPGALTAIDGAERRYECPAGAIALIQRGTRVAVETEEVKTTQRTLALGRAVMSGGLLLTKKVEKRSVQTTEHREPFAVIQRNDGEPDLLLWERRLNYQFLGAGMQPSSQANLVATVNRLRALAPQAGFDDRVARPGFAAGLGASGADPVDLALYLVRIAHERGA